MKTRDERWERFFQKHREDERVRAQDLAMQPDLGSFEANKNRMLQVSASYAGAIPNAWNRLGAQDTLVASYEGGRGAAINMYNNGGNDTGWGPDPANGAVHALTGIHHSRDNVVRAAAIELPVGDDRIVCRVDLTITFDIFTWATSGRPPHVGYCLLLKRGDRGKAMNFDRSDLSLPSDGPVVTPVEAADDYPTEWANRYYLDLPSSQSVSKTRTFATSVDIYCSNCIRLYAYAVAWGSSHHVDRKHSGGGARIIATISRIWLLPAGSVLL